MMEGMTTSLYSSLITAPRSAENLLIHQSEIIIYRFMDQFFFWIQWIENSEINWNAAGVFASDRSLS